MEYKICSKCKVEKSFGEFNKNSSTKDNLQHSCKICDTMKTSQWFKNNREKCNCYKKSYIKKEEQMMNLLDLLIICDRDYIKL